MQQLKLKRVIESNKANLGIITLEGEEVCRTLENPWLDNKAYLSCIPKGKYKVEKYSSAKYPDVWELKSVEDRTYILIHNGNLAKHTQGCILVGRNWGFLGEELAVTSSKNTLDHLREILDDEFEIEIL